MDKQIRKEILNPWPPGPDNLARFARNATCSVIIGCFNEEATIEKCIRWIHRVLPRSEILLVHGGTDRTAEIGEALMEEIPVLRVIRNRPDYGHGHAVKVGILAAKYNIQSEIDADLQFSPDDLPALLYPVTYGYCQIGNASRFTRRDNWTEGSKNFFRDIGNQILCLLVRLLTFRKVTDLTSGFKSWDRGFIKKTWFDDDKFSYCIEGIIRTLAVGGVVLDIPVSYSPRVAGTSMHRNSYEVLRAGLKMVGVIIKTWFQAFILKNVQASSYPYPTSKDKPSSISH